MVSVRARLCVCVHVALGRWGEGCTRIYWKVSSRLACLLHNKPVSQGHVARTKSSETLANATAILVTQSIHQISMIGTSSCHTIYSHTLREGGKMTISYFIEVFVDFRHSIRCVITL